MLGPPEPSRLDESTVVSLEAVMPLRNFYRHLEAKQCLGFVRSWTRELPAEHGRSSISRVAHAASFGSIESLVQSSGNEVLGRCVPYR